ncbi:MAG: hypothetical protein M1834_000343 [Cirrosporium novae-zelandiae]|nr:MAG: hypothetical protein M1834_000343 [Cirrosporium novae-zelandiae]
MKGCVRRSRQARKNKKPLKEEDPFPFLQLPAEIRNIVYGLLLTTDVIELPRLYYNINRRSAAWESAQRSAVKKAKFKNIFLEILQTCSQINIEATIIMYGCNTFKYRNPFGVKNAPDFMLPLGKLRFVRNLKLVLIDDYNRSIDPSAICNFLDRYLHTVPGLNTLSLTWFSGQHTLVTRDGPIIELIKNFKLEKGFSIKASGEVMLQDGIEEDLKAVLSTNKNGKQLSWEVVTGTPSPLGLNQSFRAV